MSDQPSEQVRAAMEALKAELPEDVVIWYEEAWPLQRFVYNEIYFGYGNLWGWVLPAFLRKRVARLMVSRDKVFHELSNDAEDAEIIELIKAAIEKLKAEHPVLDLSLKGE